MIQVFATYKSQSITKSIAPFTQQRTYEKLYHLLETNFREMKMVIGLLYIYGLLNWTFYDITTAYSQECGHKIFSMQQYQSTISVSFVPTFALMKSIQERHVLNMVELLLLDFSLKLL